MKATDMIQKLNELIEEHGDREVFSECDWQFVSDITAERGPHFDAVLEKAVDVFVIT